MMLQERLKVLHPGDVVCTSNQLLDAGDGVRFQVERNGQIGTAFAVRHGGRVTAYLNRCAHKLVELDWQEGKFFDTERNYLVCSTHGAMYDPASGRCVSGPCRGAALTAVAVHELDGVVWLAGSSSTTNF
jgi:nitrite reductase/ring-hydroxylating ferredoxin subunit